MAFVENHWLNFDLSCSPQVEGDIGLQPIRVRDALQVALVLVWDSSEVGGDGGGVDVHHPSLVQVKLGHLRLKVQEVRCLFVDVYHTEENHEYKHEDIFGRHRLDFRVLVLVLVQGLYSHSTGSDLSG